jgi:hypothetical protein
MLILLLTSFLLNLETFRSSSNKQAQAGEKGSHRAHDPNIDYCPLLR